MTDQFVCDRCLTSFVEKKALKAHSSRCSECLMLMITQLMRNMELLKSSHIQLAKKISEIETKLSIPTQEEITEVSEDEAPVVVAVKDPAEPKQLKISVDKDNNIVKSDGSNLEITDLIEAIIKKKFEKLI